MGGKGLEYGAGTAAALGGVAATVFGMPELGIPLLLGGIGMDTGTAAGGTKGGLLGGALGGAAGMGAEGLGAGSLGIPQLFGEGAAGATSAVDTAAQGAATAAKAAPAAASTAPVTGTLEQAGPTVQAQVAPETQADVAAAPGATPAASKGSDYMKLGSEALKAGGPSLANMVGGGGQAMQVPPMPARPAQPQVPAPSTGAASTAAAIPTPNPMAALADYHSFLSDIYKPVGAA